jgi:hypothetical protein
MAKIEDEALNKPLVIIISGLIGPLKLVLHTEVLQLVQRIIRVICFLAELQEQLPQRGAADVQELQLEGPDVGA